MIRTVAARAHLRESPDDRQPAHAHLRRHRGPRRADRRRELVPALPPAAAENRGAPDAARRGRTAGDPARPFRRPPRLRPHAARPLLRTWVLPRTGPAVA